MTFGGEGVIDHDVINCNLWAGKNLHDCARGNSRYRSLGSRPRGGERESGLGHTVCEALLLSSAFPQNVGIRIFLYTTLVKLPYIVKTLQAYATSEPSHTQFNFGKFQAISSALSKRSSLVLNLKVRSESAWWFCGFQRAMRRVSATSTKFF